MVSLTDVDLTCNACGKLYKEPCILKCLHSFCYECVNNNGGIMFCPCCGEKQNQEETRPNYIYKNVVAYRSLRNIKDNVVKCGNCEKDDSEIVVYCDKCEEYLCGDCCFYHKNTKLTKQHKLTPRKQHLKRLSSSGEERQVYCVKHCNDIVEQYCMNCTEIVCKKCCSHAKHDLINVSEAYDKERTHLNEILTTAADKMLKHEETAASCCQIIDKLRNCKVQLSQRITSFFTALKEQIETLEKSLSQQLLVWFDEHFKLVKDVQSYEEKCVQKISDSVNLSKMLLEHGSQVEILSLKSLIYSRLNRVARETNGDKNIKLVQNNINNATWRTSDVPQMRYIEEYLRLPAVTKELTDKKKSINIELTHVECKDTDEINTNNKNLSRESKGTHVVEGKVPLWRRLRDVMIERRKQVSENGGRDYRYDKIIRSRSIGKQGTGYGEFYHPCDIAVDVHRHDRIIVSDYNNDRIQVFNHFGDFLFLFGTRGSKFGQFLGPTGVAVLQNGTIIVCDSLNNRVQMFTSKGKYYNSFGEEGRNLGQFWRPMGIAVDHKERIIVVDQGNNRLQVYDKHGDICFAFGQLGHWDGQMSCPNFVAIDNEDNIYVSDEVNFRIQIFDKYGVYLRQITAKEVHGYNGNLGLLSGIAVDNRGYVIVSRKNLCGVQVFSADGRFVRSFLSKYSAMSRLQFTSGISLTSAGEIVVADWLNNRIRFF